MACRARVTPAASLNAGPGWGTRSAIASGAPTDSSPDHASESPAALVCLHLRGPHLRLRPQQQRLPDGVGGARRPVCGLAPPAMRHSLTLTHRAAPRPGDGSSGSPPGPGEGAPVRGKGAGAVSREDVGKGPGALETRGCGRRVSREHQGMGVRERHTPEKRKSKQIQQDLGMGIKESEKRPRSRQWVFVNQNPEARNTKRKKRTFEG